MKKLYDEIVDNTAKMRENIKQIGKKEQEKVQKRKKCKDDIYSSKKIKRVDFC